MIPACVVFSYLPRFLPRAWLAAALLALAGCAVPFRAPVGTARFPIITSGRFNLPDGESLPYRAWLAKSTPRAIVLGLHGFDDSRDAWAMAAPALTHAGIAIFAPDQRGFGAAPHRGFWPGTARLVRNARSMVAILHRRYPDAKLTVMGESMGGAVALLLGAEGDPEVSSYVLVSPAVWGGEAMAPRFHASMAVGDFFVPWLRLTGQQAHVKASDNLAALYRLFKNPLTIRSTRIGTVAGMVRLMGDAQAACARFAPPHALVLYKRTRPVDPEARRGVVLAGVAGRSGRAPRLLPGGLSPDAARLSTRHANRRHHRLYPAP